MTFIILFIERKWLMDIRIMKYFLAVAREGSITRAAEVLFVSQPVISRQIQLLENELGCQLIVRGKRIITLTDEGHLFRQRAQEIVDLAEKTKNEFKNIAGAVGGSIIIGSGDLISSKEALSRLLKQIFEKYPQIRFNFYSNTTDLIKERMEKGLVDFGILLEPTDLSRYEYVKLPATDRWGLLVSVENELAQKKEIYPKDLVGQRIFGSNRPTINSILSNWAGKYANSIFDYQVQYNLIHHAAVLVEANLGVALCIEGAVSLYKNPSVVFVPLYQDIVSSSVIAWLKGRMTSLAAEKFIECIHQEYGISFYQKDTN